MARPHSWRAAVQGDVQQHMAPALADRDSFYKERARALSVMHSELEDEHSDTLRSLRENEDMVCCCPGCLPQTCALEGVHPALHT